MQGRNYGPDLRQGLIPNTRPSVFATHHPGHVMLRTEDWKYGRFQHGDGSKELCYNLATDPQELHPLTADQCPVIDSLRSECLDRVIQSSNANGPRILRF